MKKNDPIIERGKKIFARLLRYKYVLFVIAIGAVLLSWPEPREDETEQISAFTSEEDFSVDALEKKLANTLSEVDGAGAVQVMLTVQSGMKRVYVQDGSTEQDDSGLTRKVETVIVSTGTGKQETVLAQQIYPQFYGALIVADGGADPNVRLKLTQAVAALTGLGADKISICKRK